VSYSWIRRAIGCKFSIALDVLIMLFFDFPLRSDDNWSSVSGTEEFGDCLLEISSGEAS